MEATNTSQTNPKRSANIIFVIAAVVFVLALAGGFYYHNKNKSNTSNQKQVKTGPYKYTYSKFDPYTLLGEASGDGITFQKPTEITGPDTQKSSNIRLNQNTFFQYVNSHKNNQAAQIGQVLVASSATNTPMSDADLKTVNAEINKPGSKTASSYKSSLQSYLATRLTKYDISITSLKSLNTSNLSNNAWGALYTATTKKSADSALFPNMKGEIVLAAGQHAFYYFSIDTVDYNWDNNQTVWPNVINSIKIDQ